MLIELFDEQIRGEEFLMQNYDLPVLAVVPELLDSPSVVGKDYYYGEYAASGKRG